MRKSIKICFLDFWSGFDYMIMTFYRILCNHYEVTVVNSWVEAEYVFFSCFGTSHWEVDGSKIKIFFTAENISPDFNVCDYAIGFDYLSFGDRYLRQSNFYDSSKYEDVFYPLLISENYRNPAQKLEFCSFTVSNAFANEYRVELFNSLNKYKKVNSGGRYMNNIGGPITDKLLFDSSHKFSICCENSMHPGYTTEKIYQAFAAGCIPIYWGDPEICKVFNEKAFIYANKYQNIEDVVRRVEEVDTSESLYLAMLEEPIFLDPQTADFQYQKKKLSEFLRNIIDQEPTEARRYSRHSTSISYLSNVKDLIRNSNKPTRQLIKERLRMSTKALLDKFSKS